jgi:hypothetical protein
MPKIAALSDAGLAAVMADIDPIQRLNDEFGHCWCDEGLRPISSIFSPAGAEDRRGRSQGGRSLRCMRATGLCGS